MNSTGKATFWLVVCFVVAVKGDYLSCIDWNHLRAIRKSHQQKIWKVDKVVKRKGQKGGLIHFKDIFAHFNPLVHIVSKVIFLSKNWILTKSKLNFAPKFNKYCWILDYKLYQILKLLDHKSRIWPKIAKNKCMKWQFLTNLGVKIQIFTAKNSQFCHRNKNWPFFKPMKNF